MSFFPYARLRTADFEGGFSDDPHDAGGATRWGASEPYARAHGYTGPMADLPRATVDRWFRADFWDAYGLEGIPDREVAARIFDAAVNHSPRGVAGIVQRAVRAIWPATWGDPIAADSEYGPATAAAVGRLAARYPASLVGAINGERWRYYLAIVATRPDQARFIRGWAARCATIAVAIAIGCGGPTDPLGLAAPVELRGRIADQFTFVPVAGARVRFQGVTATTDTDGRFAIVGITNGRRLEVDGSTMIPRRTYAWDGDSVWRVVPAGYDTAAFRALARGFTGSGSTVRWPRAPIVYIDTRAHGSIPAAALATWITETEAAVPGFLADWSDGTLPATVVRTASPPADLTTGTIVIRFSELAEHYGGSASIGYARVWWGNNYGMTAATVSLRYLRYRDNPAKRRGILGHELGHATGYAHTAAPSLMQPSLGSKTDLLPGDRTAARFLYGRVPGNTAPDVDRRTRIGLALAVPGGSWEGP